MADEQGCPRRSTERTGSRQVRDGLEDQGRGVRHRKKAEDNGRTPSEMSIQCGEAGRTGETGDTRLRRRKARRKGNEAPGEGARRCRPRVSGKRRNGALVARRSQWRRAQELGAADARQDKRAAKRAQGPHADKLEQDTEYVDKDETVKYVPRERLTDWDGAAVRLDLDNVVDPKASAKQAKSTAHVRRANYGGDRHVRGAGRDGK